MGFLVVVLTVVFGVHYYLWRRLVRATTLPGRARRILTGVLVGLLVALMVAMVGTRGLDLGEAGHLLAWPGYLWLAVMFYLTVILVVLEIPRAVALLVLKRGERRPAERVVAVPVPAGGAPAPPQPERPLTERPLTETPLADTALIETTLAETPLTEGSVHRLDRRLFLSRTAATVAGLGALATVGYGVRTALGDPVIQRVPVRLPRLDPRMSGLRFAVVSDIHLGPLTGITHSERIVRMINELEPDVVAIVGDLVDGTVAELGALARPLRSIESRYGAYFVTGNHEYYTANGPQEWIAELDTLGVRSLRNERVEIHHAGAVLDLAGVNDVNGQVADDGPDMAKALTGRDSTRPVVLLSHQPVQVFDAAKFGVDLQLSGHTHGGQMAPFNLIVPLQQPVVQGLDTVDGTQIYVTRGAGFWGPPVRVGAPPELTLVELQT
ncbi:metallophosphoesterase [Acrocarpospora catenulata]|uniref:metallophosphoesterase n=1 Tax=Acrocarpospora catenulata TaxID=2836182 RepID=UPI0027DFD2BE|nr:metallophosphoesterase [Acrocarpospora catenulata]